MPRRSIAQIEADRHDAVANLAQLYARYFVTHEPDVELDLRIDATEDKLRNAYPQEFKKIERQAINLALGNNG